MAIPSHLRCDEVVERASDYLERALASGDAEELEQHLVLCGACAEYVEQLRAVVEAASQLRGALTSSPDPRMQAGAGTEPREDDEALASEPDDGARETSRDRGGGAIDAERLESLLRAFRTRPGGRE